MDSIGHLTVTMGVIALSWCTTCSGYIAHLRRQCRNVKCVIFQEKLLKGLKCCNFLMSAATTELLSSGEFCKLRYDTIPVNIAPANVSWYTNNSKITNFELRHSCRKWAIYWMVSNLSRHFFTFIGRLRLKCDGTRAETRFRLSVKRTSPFKSAAS